MITSLVHQDTTTLESLPSSAADIDVGVDGEYVAICRRDANLLVVSSIGYFAAPSDIRFPLVRWLAAGDILVIDARTTKGRDNAFVFTPAGNEKQRFFVGDGVEDVVSVGEKIVVTYFDEGVFSGITPSEQGLCVFKPDGQLEFGYQSGVRGAVDIADCYCACAAGRYEVCFSSYTGFPLVRLNLKTRQQQVYELPENLAGASAISTDGITYYLYSPYKAKGSIFQWRPSETAIEIGTHSGPLRGHGRGTFLSTGTSGYTILYAERT